MKLHNRRFLKTQKFDILRTSLKIEKKTPLDSVEYEVSFEHIHNKKKVQTITNNNFLVLSFFLFVIGLLLQIGSNVELSITLLLGAVIFLGLALTTRQKTITIPTYDGDKIELFFNSRNKQEVLDFSNKVIEASNSFLLNKYGKIDKALPLEGQLSNLHYLRDRDTITDEEYENFKNQLLGRENKGSLGFVR
ncbi:MAG: hypothetical protein H7122_10850 [Chitinophagaceae bacterium]|nr:hypothetical protein [Chitinophagaceae bacterium]